MRNRVSKKEPSWEKAAIILDTKVRETVAAQILFLPGVNKVVDYSNSYKKGSSPHLASDIDLIIRVDDSENISSFVPSLEYCLTRYPMFFRNLPWVIPQSLWKEFIDTQPYDVAPITSLITAQQTDTYQKFFSHYELMLECFFAALEKIHKKQFDRLLTKYLHRTEINLAVCTKIFYPSKGKKLQQNFQIPDEIDENNYLSVTKVLQKSAEQLSSDLSELLQLSTPIEQIAYLPGSSTGIFFVPPEIYKTLSPMLANIKFLSLKVMNSRLLAYAQAMATPNNIKSMSKSKAFETAFLKRQILHQKILDFIEKNELQGKVTLPYFARVKDMRKLKLRY